MKLRRNLGGPVRFTGVLGPWVLAALLAPKPDGGPTPPMSPPSAAPQSSPPKAPTTTPDDDAEVIRELEFLEALELVEGLDMMMDVE